MKLKFLDSHLKKITLDINDFCNLQCKVCFLTGLKKRNLSFSNNKNNSFTLALFKRLVEQLKNFDNYSEIKINLSGGEPFLNPEISDILSFAKKNKMKIIIFTNGININQKILLATVRSQPAMMMFSIDGSLKEHDANRGRGSFSKTIKTIKEINYLKKKLSFSMPKLAINTVINKLNIASFDNVIPLAKKMQCESLYFSLVQWTNHLIIEKSAHEFNKRFGNYNQKAIIMEGINHEFGNLKKDEISQLIRKIRSIKKSLPQAGLDICFFPDFSVMKEYERWFLKDCYRIDSCTNIFEQLRIDYNGNVFPGCSIPFYKLGNIKDESLSEILNGKKAKMLYRSIKKDGFFYICQRCCRRPAKSITLN